MRERQRKKFLNYQEQIDLLTSKKLTIKDKDIAINKLKKYSYYSLVCGYKDIFKVEKNGDYKDDASFDHLVTLYEFDDSLRYMFLHEIIRIEKKVKSLYSYSFCELYGDKQNDYLNVTNYNYQKYQKEINVLTSKIQDVLDDSQKYPNINYNLTTYGTVPLWVLIHTLTFGSLSKMFEFSKQELQSKVAREFENVYGHQLISMLNVLSKFRNVCAHSERLYNYTTQKAIVDLPIHKKLNNYNQKSKNDLFNVFVCLKYLSDENDFLAFSTALIEIVQNLFSALGEHYANLVLERMGFPKNWEDIITLDK